MSPLFIVPNFFDYAEFYDSVIEKYDADKWRACEVGVFNGASALYLLQNAKNIELHLVDNFKNSSIFHALTYLRDYYDRIIIHPADSEVAAYHFPNSFFDFIFLDADHSFEGLTNDLKLYDPLLRDGGIIAGHDYSHPKYKVKKAVDSFYNSSYTVWQNRVWSHAYAK